MNEQFKKGIDELRKLGPTYAEREEIFARITAVHPARAPFGILRIMHLRLVYLSVLLIILAGGAVARAAEGSLPGQLLYPVKVRVTEPVRDVLTVEPAARARWESQKLERRIDEAIALTERKELTQEQSQKIEAALTHSASTTIVALQELTKKSFEKDEEERELHRELEEKLKEHEELFKKSSYGAETQEKREEKKGVQPQQKREPEENVEKRTRENKEGDEKNELKKNTERIEQKIRTVREEIKKESERSKKEQKKDPRNQERRERN